MRLVPMKAFKANSAFAVGLLFAGCAGFETVLEDFSAVAAAASEDVRLRGEVLPSAEEVPSFDGEPGIVKDPNVLDCGQQLVCAEGWELRVLSTDVPTDRMPAGAVVLAQSEIQNRGREPSPAVEVRFCAVPERDSRASACQGRYELVTLPPLAPGETVTLRKPVEVPTREGRYRAGVRIDPDGLSGHRSGNNSAGVSEAFRSELPGLQWLSIDTGGPYRRPGPLSIRFEVRNESFVASTDSIVVQPRQAVPGSFQHIGASQFRFVIPALGPREVYRGSVTLRNGIQGVHHGGSRRFNLIVDPDSEQRWTSRSGVHQGRARVDVQFSSAQ